MNDGLIRIKYKHEDWILYSFSVIAYKKINDKEIVLMTPNGIPFNVLIKFNKELNSYRWDDISRANHEAINKPNEE